MKIVDIETYEVAIPFKAPILSSFGVSYPARIRTFVRLHTDDGLVGIGETGPSPLHPYTPGTMPRAFQTSIKAAIVGEHPADHAWIARKLYHRPEAIAIEIACFDLLAKAAGLPLYRLLGGQGHRASVPLARCGHTGFDGGPLPGAGRAPRLRRRQDQAGCAPPAGRASGRP